ncbi:MAG: ATP-binding cassette domain-containing protein, partial [Flavobacteriales bacterium]|nr:ATP-binding cassette domain-containing protein [Flavobacteriales bacterium]
VENLEIACIIKEVEYDRIEPALELVGLSSRKHDPFKAYSLGMKQRLAIASAFLTDPEVMILDEPTNGLDPMGIADIRKLIRQIADLGKTIVIASHLLDEVQKVCSHFCVLQTGNLIYQGSVKDDFSDKTIVTLAAPDMEGLGSQLQTMNDVIKVEREGDFLVAECSTSIDTSAFNKDLANHSIYLSHLSLRHRSLEEQFIKILEDNNEKTA